MALSGPGLLAHARDVTSQFGEDGVIEAILERLPDRVGWCVEFGAWDGLKFSNTFNLIANHGFSGILIESDPNRYRDLRSRYASTDKVTALHARVGYDREDSLDALLSATLIPLEYDLLSIDIDGNDYHAWEATTRYRPRTVVVEYNPTIPNSVDFVQKRDHRVSQGSSLRALQRLGLSKGYELVGATWANAVFVTAGWFPRMGLAENSLSAIRPNEEGVTHLFSGYDGTVFLRGNRRMEWHGVDYEEERVQQLPAWLRAHPARYGPLRRRLGRLYFAWRKRRQLRREGG